MRLGAQCPHRMFKATTARKSRSSLTLSLRAVCLALLVACLPLSHEAFITCAPAQAAESRPEHYALPNGLKVLIWEDHSFPVVSCMSWYRVGSRNETMGTTGLSHLVEHMLFRSVGAFKSGEVGVLIARSGGQFNGFTSDDFTTFFEVLPPSRLELALKIAAERLKGVSFSPAEMKEEIEHIEQEFEKESRDSVQSLIQEVRSLTFQQHPYHVPTMGWRGDVEKLTPAAAQAFYDRYFRTDNSTLVVVGDVSAAHVRSLVQKYFGGIAKKAGTVPALAAVEPSQRGERRVTIRHNGRQDFLHVAYHAPAVHEADAPAMAVVERLLNAAFNGRLKSRLVASRLCTSAQCAFEMKKDPGLFTFSCHAVPGVGEQELLDGLDGLVNQLKTQPVSDAELRRARNQAEFSYSSEGDGPYRAAFHLGYFDSLAEWQGAFTWPERLRAVTAADLQRVAKRYFNADGRVVGWLAGPASSKPPAPKPPPEATPPQKEPQKVPGSRQAMHVRMTGYKADDFAPAPGRSRPGQAALISPTAQIAPGPQLAQSVHKTAVSAASQAATTPAPAAAQSAAEPRKSQPPAAEPAARRASSGGGSGAATSSQADRSKPGAAKAAEPKIKRAGHKQLANGLNLIVFESHLTPVVQISGSVRAGQVCDPAGKKGLSAVVAALMNNGSSKHSRSQLVNAQEDMGLPPWAMISFEDGAQSLSFQARCLSRDLPTQLSNICEILSSPPSADADIERAKQDAAADIKKAGEPLAGRVQQALLRSLVSPASPYYPADEAERLKSISALKAADVKAFASQHLAPNVTTVVLSGDITMEQAVQFAERTFGQWTAKAASPMTSVEPTSRKILRTTIPRGASASGMLCLGQLLPLDINHADYPCLLLAECALNNHPIVSRLGQRFGSEPRLAAAVGYDELTSKLEPLGNSTVWSLTLSMPPEVVAAAVQSLMAETRRFARNGLTQDELNEVKRYLVGFIPVRMLANLSSVGRSLLRSLDQGADPASVFRLPAAVTAASLDQVNRVVRGVMKPDQAALVLAGRGETIKTIRQEVGKQQVDETAAPARPAAAKPGPAKPARANPAPSKGQPAKG